MHGRVCVWQAGHAWQGDVHDRGSVVREAATAADGTHPNGMHSCSSYLSAVEAIFRKSTLTVSPRSSLGRMILLSPVSDSE